MNEAPAACAIVVSSSAFAFLAAYPPKKSLVPQEHTAPRLNAAGRIVLGRDIR
jgi:hypothetical protein